MCFPTNFPYLPLLGCARLRGRTRPLLSGAKVMAINMPGFGIEGKRRIIFIFSLGEWEVSIFLQGVSMANTNCRLEQCHHFQSGSWGIKSHCQQFWGILLQPWLSLPVPSELWIWEGLDSTECCLEQKQGGDSGIGVGFPWVPPAQRQDSRGAAPSRDEIAAPALCRGQALFP